MCFGATFCWKDQQSIIMQQAYLYLFCLLFSKEQNIKRRMVREWFVNGVYSACLWMVFISFFHSCMFTVSCIRTLFLMSRRQTISPFWEPWVRPLPTRSWKWALIAKHRSLNIPPIFILTINIHRRKFMAQSTWRLQVWERFVHISFSITPKEMYKWLCVCSVYELPS